MGSVIKFTDIFRIKEPHQYKLHLGSTNPDGERPLDMFIQDENIWKGWNEWRGSQNDWTRDYIFSVIEFYLIPNKWIFAGIFEVLERNPDGYVIKLAKMYNNLIGRVLFDYHRTKNDRGRDFYLENKMDNLSISEIIPERFEGKKKYELLLQERLDYLAQFQKRS